MSLIKMFLSIGFLSLISGCSARSDLQLPLAAISQDYAISTDQKQKNASAVTGKQCHIIYTFPFFWNVNTTDVFKNVLASAPGAIALRDVKITKTMRFYFIFSKACTELTGVPVYLQG